jgi:hypothetical protein
VSAAIVGANKSHSGVGSGGEEDSFSTSGVAGDADVFCINVRYLFEGIYGCDVSPRPSGNRGKGRLLGVDVVEPTRPFCILVVVRKLETVEARYRDAQGFSICDRITLTGGKAAITIEKNGKPDTSVNRGGRGGDIKDEGDLLVLCTGGHLIYVCTAVTPCVGKSFNAYDLGARWHTAKLYITYFSKQLFSAGVPFAGAHARSVCLAKWIGKLAQNRNHACKTPFFFILATKVRKSNRFANNGEKVQTLRSARKRISFPSLLPLQNPTTIMHPKAPRPTPNN